jgi:hypothetical protein
MATKKTKQPAAKKKAPKRKAAAPKGAKSSSAAKRAGGAKKPAPRKASTSAAEPDTVSASQRIDEKLASLKDWRGELLSEIRALIHEVDPEVVEEWKWMGTPVWSHNGMLANANPFKDKVKVTFHHGAQLKDPHKVFNNGLDGNKWRAIDLYEGDKLDHTGFKALLREAIAYNDAHSVPKSKGSRTSLLKTSK